MFPSTTLDVLPDDILYDVLCHSSVRDILSLRLVSRKFHHFTHHRAIWANAYTRCPILLPPGPFSYQSAADLERTLKKSHLLEANWTSPSPCPVSRQTFLDTSVDPWGPGSHCIKLLLGRYLLMAGQPMLRCYDLESTNEEFTPIAVYACIEANFDCVVEKHSVVDDSDCQLLCAFNNKPREGGEYAATVTLLRLRISQCSAKFELVNKVRVPGKPFYRHDDVNITGDFLALGSWYQGPLLLHIPTCQVYDVPPCDLEVVGVSRSEYALTSDHLFCFSTFGSEKMLEVFPLPRGDAQPNDNDEIRTAQILTRSHKCIHNQPIEHAILLTERHYLHNNNDQSAIDTSHYTFVAIDVDRVSLIPKSGELGFLDISLESNLVTTTWTHATDFTFEGEESLVKEIETVRGSSRAGACRLCCGTADRECLIAITVSEDGDGKRVVRAKEIHPPFVEDHPDVFDGIQGRMCLWASHALIKVINWV